MPSDLAECSVEVSRGSGQYKSCAEGARPHSEWPIAQRLPWSWLCETVAFFSFSGLQGFELLLRRVLFDVLHSRFHGR